MTATLLAHQGGWDEILMVLVPIALFAALLVVANRRADKLDVEGRTRPPGDDRRKGQRDDERSDRRDGRRAGRGDADPR